MLSRSLPLLCTFFLAISTAGFGQTAPVTNTPAPGMSSPNVSPAARLAQPAGDSTAAPLDRSTPALSVVTFNSVHVDQPVIAMTFDDGPHATLTPRLLDMLAERKLKATFFVVGQNAAEYPDIMKRIAREGHEIANHSWSHPNLAKMSDDAVRAQMKKTDDAIRAATGSKTTLMRPPYGSITPRQKQWLHDDFGYRVIIWDVDPFDWKRPGPGVIRDRIVSQARPGSIILAHDIHPGTIDAMPGTFDQLMAKGLKFVTVSDLIAMAKPLPPKPRPAASAPAKSSPAPAASAEAAASSPAPARARPAGTPAPAPGS